MPRLCVKCGREESLDTQFVGGVCDECNRKVPGMPTQAATGLHCPYCKADLPTAGVKRQGQSVVCSKCGGVVRMPGMTGIQLFWLCVSIFFSALALYYWVQSEAQWQEVQDAIDRL